VGDLRWMGLGLSSNLNAADVPHPYRLLDEFPQLFDYVEYSAPLSLAAARRQASLFAEMWDRRSQVPVLFHPVHLNLYGPTLEGPTALIDLAEQLVEVGSPWVSNDVAWWHEEGQPFPGYFYLPPPFDPSALGDCTAHALHVQAAIPVPLLLENPAVIACRGKMHALDFMAQLHQRTGLDLLLDLGHLLAYQLTRGLPASTGLDGFPLDRVIEIHIAGGVVTARGERRFYVDDHTQPVRDELLEMLASLMPRCPRLRAVTFEADGHPPAIAAGLLHRLRSLVPLKSRASVQSSVAPAKLAGAPSGRAWEIFDRAYCDSDDPEDPEGAAAELDFRLAVLAEEIDRFWPLTRLLVAGTRDDLIRFARSAEFRAAFQPPGKEPATAFAAFARRRLVEAPDQGSATALAFETWVNEAGLPVRPAPRPGQVALADGVSVKSFPIDLSELQFAARAVKRHLSSRAWVAGAVEHSGLESVRQVARRAAPGPWQVAIFREGGRIEAIGLTNELFQVLRLAARGDRWEAFENRSNGCSAASARQALRLGLIRIGA
jgi:uncharacterized protein (UPF0276 family)